MNRPIKFRIYIPEAEMGYSKTGMYYQDDQYLASFLRRICDQFVVGHPSHLPFAIEDRLMQFTGVRDEEAKEIYEGDIVIFNDGNGEEVGTVTFFEGAFILRENKKDEKGRAYTSPLRAGLLRSTFKVAGNIFENSELLNK